MALKDKKNIKPFLRWAGGKSLFVNSILDYFPEKKQISRYYEPFLGAASVFFNYQPKKTKLSDLNAQLIHSFQAVRDRHLLVYKYLKEFVKEDSEKNYYKTRDQYNLGGVSIRQASRFIYLNRTCFNGIFRVNTKGSFNVPYGYKKTISIPTLPELQRLSELLQGIDLQVEDYRQAVLKAKKNDLIYLDPPYPPLNGSSYFTHYTKERFTTHVKPPKLGPRIFRVFPV